MVHFPIPGKQCKESHETHLEWLEKIENDGVNLTQWEEDFIGSLVERRDNFTGFRLTSREQEKILERIYVERTP